MPRQTLCTMREYCMAKAGLKIIGDKECPSCRDKGRDAKGNHLILFQAETGEHFGKCNRCGHYVPPEGDLKPNPHRERTPEELAEELQEVFSYPFRNLASRRIPVSVAERFGVRAGLSETDGETVVEHYYPRERESGVVAYNVRSLEPKGFYYRGSPKGGTYPFGWSQAQRGDVGRKRLLIFEDELSAMSGFAIIDGKTPEKWKHLKPACISWSAGVGSAPKDIEFMDTQGFLKGFSEVVYVYDNDDAGKASVEKVRSLLPKCKFVCMPLKDVNDMHMARREDEAFSLMLFQSKTKSPDCAVTVQDVLQEALEPVKWGKSYPWDGLTKATYGQRDGELISVGGGTGIGKTLLAHMIASHNIKVHGESVGVFLLEEAAPMSLRHIAGKLAKMIFHKPDVYFDPEVFTKAATELDGKLHLWRNKGMNDWENIKGCLRFWAIVHGCKVFFIDNITALVNHLDPASQNTEIAKIATECAGMADELGIRIFVFSHLNPPGGSKSHEEGAEVKENQFTGSRALQRWSHLMLGFERNKQADGDQKHNSLIRILKDRNYGNTGVVYTKYDLDTGCLVERPPEEVTLEAPGDDEAFN
jgi:twinkle protein